MYNLATSGSRDLNHVSVLGTWSNVVSFEAVFWDERFVTSQKTAAKETRSNVVSTG